MSVLFECPLASLFHVFFSFKHTRTQMNNKQNETHAAAKEMWLCGFVWIKFAPTPFSKVCFKICKLVR